MTVMGLPEHLSRDVGQAFFGNFASLRPLQSAAIASLCAGRDLVLSAGTGSGKTEAVVAPIVSRYWRAGIEDSGPFLLYVCPTRALVNDLLRRLEPCFVRLGLRVAVRHGDKNSLDYAKAAHVVLTTPESLGILIAKKHACLTTVRALVFDEVHLLYNNQRGLMAALLRNRLRILLGHPLQTAALSATVGDLGHLRDFIWGPDDEASVDVMAFPGARAIDGDIRAMTNERHGAKLISKLMDAPQRKLLVFVESRRQAESLSAAVRNELGSECLLLTHHSSLAPEGRETVEKQFESASKCVCVATSTLEMGIDIGDIDAVILYGPPQSVESLLQRIGRGNRRSHKTNVICLARNEGQSIREIAVFSAMIQLAREGRMPANRPYSLFGAVAQQVLAIIVGAEGAYTRVAEIAEQLTQGAHLERNLIERIVNELAGKEFLRKHSFQNRFGATEKLWDLKDRNLIWGNFPLAAQTIDLDVSGRIIGSIPRANLMRLAKGSFVRFGGSKYRVDGILDQRVLLRKWSGAGTEVPLHFGSVGKDELNEFMGAALWSWLFSVREETSAVAAHQWPAVEKVLTAIRAQLHRDSLPFASTSEGYRYFTFAGLTTNRVIAVWFGLDAEAAGEWTIDSPKQIDWSTLPQRPEELQTVAETCFSSSDRQTVFQQCLPLDLQRVEWMEGWLKNEEVGGCLSRLTQAKPRQIPANLFDSLLR